MIRPKATQASIVRWFPAIEKITGTEIPQITDPQTEVLSIPLNPPQQLDGFAHGAEVLVGERLGRGDRVGYRDALRVGAEWTFGASLLIAGGYALGAPLICERSPIIWTSSREQNTT